MEQISVAEAGERKGCTRQTVWGAIKKGDIDAQRIGRSFIVSVNRNFSDWTPSPNMQKGGRARWSTPKAKKARKTA